LDLYGLSISNLVPLIIKMVF